MGQYPAIIKFDQAMHDALWMNYNIDFLQRDAEKPHGLNDLEALVHQRGRVNANLRAHIPSGMIRRLFRGDGLKRLNGPPVKWTA